MINLTAGNITVEGETAFYAYRGKGGKRGRRELPRPAYVALLVTLADAAKSLSGMRPDESLWQAGGGARGVTSATFYNRLRKYMVAAGPAAHGCAHPAAHSSQATPRRG